VARGKSGRAACRGQSGGVLAKKPARDGKRGISRQCGSSGA
jgi:hypothetical protein